MTVPSNSLPSLDDFRPAAELSIVLDTIVDAICGIDADGRVTFCNKAFAEITGYSKEEAIGKDLHSLLQPERSDGIARSSSEFAPTNLPPVSEVHGMDECLRRKDGSSFPVEYWIRRVEPPVGVTILVVAIRDVTELQKAKEGLRESQEKFRRILARMPEVTWTADRQRRLSYVSPKIEAMLGYTKVEIHSPRSQLWISQIHAEDFGEVHQAYCDLFEKGSPYEQEYRVRRKDGAWIWVYDRAVTPHEENGELYADGFLSDITERKQAEAALQSQTAFLEAQVNSTIDGILVVDRAGQRRLSNERLAQLFQIPPELLSEKEDRKLLQYVVTLIKNPKSFLEKVNYLYRHPDKTSRDEIELTNGMILDRYSSPVVDKSGVYYGRIWTFHDITERRKSEDALQQLSLAVEQSPVSVVITDPMRKITYVNRKFTESTGYTAKEVIGKDSQELNEAQCNTAVFQNLWATLEQGKVWRGEFCNTKKNGESFWETATITPITNLKGTITHYLAVKEDITERRALEGQLRHAQKLEGIGQLAAGIAHEINTPTQFVTDNLTFLRDSWNATYELLEQYRKAAQAAGQAFPSAVLHELRQAEEDCDLPFIVSEVPRAIEQSLEGAGRVAKIVHAMKEFSHPDSADKTATDLNKTIDSTITVARNEWKYVSELVKDFEDNLPAVVCYPGDINQVVLNLIVNAAHTIKEKVRDGEKGQITVRTRKRSDCVEISVTDTGKGIPEAIRNRVFDPFFTTKEVGKGTGQGLALAYTVVVKKHGGKIWFESEVEKGTTFFVTLPTLSLDSSEEA